MARRESNGIGKENIRNIQKSKRSYYITLPISDVRKLGWNKAGKAVVVCREGKQFVISDFRGQPPDFSFRVSTKWRKKSSKK